MKIFEEESLVDLYKHLDDFAYHHKLTGGRIAYKMIINEFVDKLKDQPRDGSKDGLLLDKGYDRAISDVIALLYKEFKVGELGKNGDDSQASK